MDRQEGAHAHGSAAKPKCQGKTATIVGTRKGERIGGTARRDVIVAKGGNDRIRDTRTRHSRWAPLVMQAR